MLLLLLNALASTTLRLVEHAQRPKQGAHRVSSYLAAMESLRPHLQGEKEVGFLTDVPPERLFSDPEATARYYLAQYALAPAVVKNGAKATKVVGVFLDPTMMEQAARLHGLRVEVSRSPVVLWKQGGEK